MLCIKILLLSSNDKKIIRSQFVTASFFVLSALAGGFDKNRHNTTKVMLLKAFDYGKMERESDEPKIVLSASGLFGAFVC